MARRARVRGVASSAGRTRSRAAFGWILALGALVILTGLGLCDPWPADEPRFAQVAREMVATGNWMFPMHGGELYSDKPPVVMWIVAALNRLTGEMRLPFLLPSALAGLGTLWLTHDIARRLWDRRTADTAALLLIATLQFVLQARTAQIDALVCFWITPGTYGLLRHVVAGPAAGWYFTAWFAMGLGIITKGVGFLPVLLPWAAPVFVPKRGLATVPSVVRARSSCSRPWGWLVPALLAVHGSTNPMAL